MRLLMKLSDRQRSETVILGIEGVVQSHEVEPGRYYLEPSYSGEARLFQCIQTADQMDGNPVCKAVYFFPSEERSLTFGDLPYDGPLVAMPPVKIRVDPPTIIGSGRSVSYSAGMFFIMDGEAYVTAHLDRYGWAAVNISTGRTVEGQISHQWIAFSRWLLIVEENGEEIPIASFGE